MRLIKNPFVKHGFYKPFVSAQLVFNVEESVRLTQTYNPNIIVSDVDCFYIFALLFSTKSIVNV